MQYQKGLDQLALMPNTPNVSERNSNSTTPAGRCCLRSRGGRTGNGPSLCARTELWEQLGSPSELLRLSHGRIRFFTGRGELDLAQRLNEELLRLSRQQDDLAGLIIGHTYQAGILMFAGTFASSQSHYEKVLALYDPVSHRSLAHQVGVSPQVTALGQWGIDALCLGFPDRGLAWSNKAVVAARELDHPPSLRKLGGRRSAVRPCQ